MHILKTKLDSKRKLAKHFMPHQLAWINAENAIHAQHKQAVALAEKSVRIGWTYADAFKNVRKRIWFNDRDYLFATKDYPSALEYVRQCYKFAEIFNLTRSVKSHGEEIIAVNRLDEHGRPSVFTEDIKIGVIKFDNGSRIIAFSANPQAMSVYGGDVGLDEFAKHPNAELLWQTAQARVTWNCDMAVWSSHDGEDTLFNQFAQQARLCSAGVSPASSPGVPPGVAIENPNSKIENSPIPSLHHSITPLPQGPWNLYFRVTMPDAVQLGLLDVINRTAGANFTAEQFLADCRARATSEEIFQQSYMCNPLGATTAHIVEWSAIERCRYDYPIERLHFEADDVTRRFGQFNPNTDEARQRQIHDFIVASFPKLFASASARPKYRLGFDVAASGQGDLAVMYIDEYKDAALWLRALFTCRTEDWQFIATVLYAFLDDLRSLEAAGDESGLGRQICWQAAADYSYRFTKVNFTSSKQDLGFTLMNQLSSAEKRFPRSQQDIAAGYFALRKAHNGTRWVFSESTNSFNPASHCDIAWAGALASHVHTQKKPYLMSMLG